jgi:hypothetical protein
MTTASEALTRVQDALDTLRRALETGRPDVVLAAEGPLSASVLHLSASERSVAPADRGDVRQRLLETRLALTRCRTLGDASAELAAAAWPQAAYGPKGLPMTRAWSPTVSART